MFGWTLKPDVAPDALSAAGCDVMITGNAGLVDGTRVATRRGWVLVETLCAGEEVLTFDHGFQPIREIQTDLYEAGMRPGQRPVRVPRGVLGNAHDLWLMPDQGVVVESDAVQDHLGDPFAVIPARALDGFRDIAVTPTKSLFEVTILSFARDEAIYIDGGMLAFCPLPRDLLGGAVATEAPLYDVLDIAAARDLVDTMIRSEIQMSFSCDPEEVACVKSRKRARPARLVRL